jgi:hypothetical protein
MWEMVGAAFMFWFCLFIGLVVVFILLVAFNNDRPIEPVDDDYGEDNQELSVYN